MLALDLAIAICTSAYVLHGRLRKLNMALYYTNDYLMHLDGRTWVAVDACI